MCMHQLHILGDVLVRMKPDLNTIELDDVWVPTAFTHMRLHSNNGCGNIEHYGNPWRPNR